MLNTIEPKKLFLILRWWGQWDDKSRQH